jgi:hypothetical protein
MDAAKLHLHVFSVLAWADGVLDEQEKASFQQVRDRLIGAGLTSEEVDSLWSRAPQTSDAFDLKAANFSEDHRRAVLVDGWQLVLMSKGDRKQAQEAFFRLCRRLNLGDAATELQAHAEVIFTQSGPQSAAAVVATAFIGGELDPKVIERALSILIRMDPSGAAANQSKDVRAAASTLAAAVAAVAAVATDNAKLLPIIGKAYASMYGAVLERGGSPATLRDRAIQLGSQLGVSQSETGEYVDELRSTIDAQFEKAQQATKDS